MEVTKPVLLPQREYRRPDESKLTIYLKLFLLGLKNITSGFFPVK